MMAMSKQQTNKQENIQSRHPHEHSRKMAPAELAEKYLGNVSESEALAKQVSQAQQGQRCFEVPICRRDRARGRILTRLPSGQTVGLIKGRDWLLRDGDVLATDQGNLVLICLQPQQLMALRFVPDVRNSAIALMHLGHVLGNHHWPITVQGETLYVELVAEANLMESTIRSMAETLGLEGLQVAFEVRSPDEALAFSSDHVHH